MNNDMDKILLDDILYKNYGIYCETQEQSNKCADALINKGVFDGDLSGKNKYSEFLTVETNYPARCCFCCSFGEPLPFDVYIKNNTSDIIIHFESLIL